MLARTCSAVETALRLSAKEARLEAERETQALETELEQTVAEIAEMTATAKGMATATATEVPSGVYEGPDVGVQLINDAQLAHGLQADDAHRQPAPMMNQDSPTLSARTAPPDSAPEPQPVTATNVGLLPGKLP